MAGFLGAGLATGSSLMTPADARVQIQDKNGNTLVRFDASLAEEYNTEIVPTAFPIEGGASISDHLIHAPFELKVQGIISDHPLASASSFLTEGLNMAIGAIVPPLLLTGADTALAGLKAMSGDPTPSRAAYDALKRIQLGDPIKGTPPGPVTVRCRLGVYHNMVLRSLTVPRDAGTSGFLTYQVIFTQMKIAIAQTINVNGALGNAALSSGKKEIGDQGLTSRFPEGLADYESMKGAVMGGGG